MMESRLGFDAMAALALAGTALLGEEPAAHRALLWRPACSGVAQLRVMGRLSGATPSSPRRQMTSFFWVQKQPHSQGRTRPCSWRGGTG